MKATRVPPLTVNLGKSWMGLALCTGALSCCNGFGVRQLAQRTKIFLKQTFVKVVFQFLFSWTFFARKNIKC